MTASLHALGMGRDAGLYYVNDPNREARSRARDEYYARDGGGTWWSSGETIVRHGADIDKASFRDLCAGVDPATGKALVRGSGPTHRAGWDVTFSAPKSLSILWMAGDDRQREMLHGLHRAAVQEALRFLVSERLIEVRLGQGGYIREAATDIIVAQFDHFTSREGDPNIHTHSVLMNVAGCRDTKHRTLEPKTLFESQLLIGAAFRASLSQLLSEKGFQFRRAGRGQFEIAGLPEALIEEFSKRSRQIEERVGRDASGAQKELAALATRGAKDEVPVGHVLEQRWKTELATFDIDPWSAAHNHVPALSADLIVDHFIEPPAVDGAGPVAIAASALFKHQSVITRKDLLLRSFVEASLMSVGIDDVMTELNSHEQHGRLENLAGRDRAKCWTTPSIAATEASLLRSADRPDERDWFHINALNTALADARHLSDEQVQAVRFSANRDGVGICEAAAGSGKTTLARALVDAAHRSGLKTLGLCPTWVAADELSKSVGIDALAIAKWRYDHERGLSAEIDDKTLIVVDEAGICGLHDLETVLRVAHVARAKVVCFGDRRQLQAVPGGSSLQAVADIVGRGAVLTQVRRQENAWQRAASIVMAKGDSEAGLRVYAKNERLELISGEVEARARVITVWSDYRKAYGHDVLIITRRNIDATALNTAARLALRTEGKLQGVDFELPAIDRDKKIVLVEIAKGDRIRFSENLPLFGIRNGTHGTIERVDGNVDDPLLSVRLDDGRLVEEQWKSLVRQQPGRVKLPPRISLAYAGTSYSVQGRTSAAAVLYIAKPTDAREVYVGLTRHTIDARVIVEQDRLAAVVQKTQINLKIAPSNAILRERLFSESRIYAEKPNVVDYVDDRQEFIRTGITVLPPKHYSLFTFRIARAAKRFVQAMRAESGVAHSISSIPRWALNAIIKRDITRQVGDVIHSITYRIGSRAQALKEMKRSAARDQDMHR